MPFPNEHAFRIVDPAKFKQDSFRRINDKFGKGIDPIFGQLIGETAMTLHTIRFRTEYWTFAEAKKWIKDHDYHPILSEEATGESDKSMSTIKSVFCAFEAKEYDIANPLPIKICDPKNPERVIRFKASDDTCDRYDEVILASGWDVADFCKNPVVMQFHDYQEWPIGKAVALGVIGNALYIDAEFDPPEVDDEADLVFRKICHGSIKSGSVGFIPLEYAMPGSGGPHAKALFEQYPKAKRIYTKCQLLEWTICPIPANPNALAASLERRFGRVDQESTPDNDAYLQCVEKRLRKIETTLKGS